MRTSADSRPACRPYRPGMDADTIITIALAAAVLVSLALVGFALKRFTVPPRG